jgi:predicted kinase
LRPLVIVLCGLPGSGKSTLAALLAKRLGALHWDKDELRQLLFPPPVAHDRELNDHCMELLYAALPAALARAAPPIVILDGRPFAEERQRRRALEAAAAAGAEALFVFCTAPSEVLRRRVADAGHPAADRDEALVGRLAAAWEPFATPPLTVDTARLDPDGCADLTLRYCGINISAQ